MDAALLTTIGGYRVERVLGKGGMGCVYLRHDEALARRVAVKVLHPDLVEQSEMRARFQREARALARLQSPFVVTVHAVGEDAVLGPFVVMELLEGEDLHSRLARQRQLPWREAVRIARDATQGLLVAEAAGIVHRDIKPANLFDVGERVKLTDFGLAREITTGSTITQAGLVVGTPAYLAPELARGVSANSRSDIYSLGATLFHLIAGRPPFDAPSPLEVLFDAINKEAPRLRSLVADAPPSLELLVDRMLAKDPESRPAGWVEVDQALERILQEDARPTTTAPPKIDPPLSESTLPTVAMTLAPAANAARGEPSPAIGLPGPDASQPGVPRDHAALPAHGRARRRGVLGATAALVLLGGALVWGSRDQRLARIDDGEALDVAREIEKTPVQAREGLDFLLLGHARWALGERGQAFNEWRRANETESLDERALRAALTSLESKDHDGAVPLLAAWRGHAPDEPLREMLQRNDWWPRHHALVILEERRSVTDGDRVDVALLDVAADACPDRRVGLLVLKKLGNDSAALEAIQRLRADMLGNACMLFDLPGAEDAVKKRILD